MSLHEDIASAAYKVYREVYRAVPCFITPLPWQDLSADKKQFWIDAAVRASANVTKKKGAK